MTDQTPDRPADSAPAGWYPDPQNPGQQRYWDGTAWGIPGASATGMSRPTSTNAIIALVLAILSWVMCPLIAAIVALFVARSSDKEIVASGGGLGGSGMNTATRIIAWINIGASIIGGIVFAALIALGVLFAASPNNPFNLDPAMNTRTGLSDGSYVITSVGVRVNLDSGCSYGGPALTMSGSEVKDVTVYGSGPVQCPDLVQVGAVHFDVAGGVATITSVE